VIELLNDYFGVAVACIHEHQGQVLKFMGDGILAMFDAGDEAADAHAVLQMAAALRLAMADCSARREATGKKSVGYTLALHAGDILYGNIGAETRLDFTVIGPAVNQTARLSEMHRPLDQEIIISETVASAAPNPQDLVPMGRFALRGVPRPQMLYTLYEGDDG
jgi:adenylate cyclase